MTERAGELTVPGPELARAQAGLVAALTGTGPFPPGFDPARLQVARQALLHKRAGEVRGRWPQLAAGLGTRFGPAFAAWAEHRPTRGSLQDGWDFALALRAEGRFPDLAAFELARHQTDFDYDGEHPPTPARGLRVRRGPGFLLVRIGRRTLVREPPGPLRRRGPRWWPRGGTRW